MWMQLLKNILKIGEDLESLLAKCWIHSSWHSPSCDQQWWWSFEPRSFLGTDDSRTNSSFSRTCCSRLMLHLVHLKTSKQPSQQQQRHVLVLAGHGWLSTKKVNLKSLQQQPRYTNLWRKNTNPWFGCLGTCLLREIPQRSSWLHQSFLLSY